MAGYSSTPIIQKRGIKTWDKILLVDQPDHFDLLIGEWPENVRFLKLDENQQVDFIQLFTQNKDQSATNFPCFKKKLKKNGMLWISWPKGKSNLPKDPNENDVRTTGLANGLLDVKVYAIDDDWSGLKFVFRNNDK